MKVILTGRGGTIGKVLVDFLLNNKIEVIYWDRNRVSISNFSQMEEFIISHHPDALIHLAAITSFDTISRQNSWQVNYEWTSELAWICNICHIRFVFTSTSMVFTGNLQLPLSIDSIPDAEEGYGYEKRMAEKRIIYQNPDSIILRLGWQIDPKGLNTINHYCDTKMNQDGIIHANKNWYPSCSFLEDTVDVIYQSLAFDPGIYMINANKKWSFFEIVTELNKYYDNQWIIEPSYDIYLDNRMMDEKIKINDLRFRLTGLT